MSRPADGTATQRFERALASVGDQRYVLRLFVAGATARSRQAIARLTATCEAELAGRYTLEVVDVYQRPQLAAEHQIVAVPTLIRHLPTPVSRIVGDLSGAAEVLLDLDPFAPRRSDHAGPTR